MTVITNGPHPNGLTAGDALHSPIERVYDDLHAPLRCPAGAKDTIYAVFAPPRQSGETFRGLVSASAIAAFPGRAFSDILPSLALPVVSPGMAAGTVHRILVDYRAEALAVMDGNTFVGAVSHQSLLLALLNNEQPIRAALHRSRIAALELFTLSARHDVEEDLLRSCIEILAQLVGARYGAIALHAANGRIGQFVHTGIPSDEAALIGTPPSGEGVLGVVEQEERPLRLDDLRRHPRFTGFPPHHPPMADLVAAPIALNGKVCGRVYLSEREDGAPFSADDERLLGEFARAISQVVAQAQSNARSRTLASVVEQTGDAVTITDIEGVIEFVNRAFEKTTFYTRSEAIGEKPNLVKSGRQDQKFYQSMWDTLLRGEIYQGVLINRRKDGALYQEAKTISPLRDAEGRITHFVSSGRDLSRMLEARDLSNRLWAILDRSAEEIYVFDAQTLRFRQVNEVACRNLGYELAEIIGMTPIDIAPQFDRAGFEAVIEPLREGRQDTVMVEIQLQRKNGTLYPVEARLQLSRDEIEPVFVAMMHDISEHLQREQQLRYLAYHDILTGLPNRAALLDRLAQALTEADRHQRLVAVFFLDLDRFKEINDNAGHEAGDQSLRAVANRLTAITRPGDTVARFGGDEFALVLANIADVHDVARLAQKLCDSFQAPLSIGGTELTIATSIGITLYPLDAREPEMLLRNADAAMYQAKKQGGNQFSFYTEELNSRLRRQMSLETSLRGALDRGEFLLHYQPQIDPATGRTVGVEALIRWQNGEELIAPKDFIPLAEKINLIVPIGEWVISAACSQLAAWRAAGLPPLRMSVNLSARQLREPSLAKAMERLKSRFGVSANDLTLEITQRAIMHDLDGAGAAINAFHELGVQLAFDDFGACYSGIGCLKHLPISLLKFDQSVVSELDTDPQHALIVQALIALARNLGIEVMAAGVETRSQLAFLRRHGCGAVQGFYTGEPLRSSAMTAWLHQQGSGTPADPAAGSARRTLLIVDPDENIRKTLPLVLRDQGYAILTASGPGQAFELLAQHPIAVVLAEQRLPETAGADFVTRVKAIYPDIVCLLLSGYGELPSITRAIRTRVVFNFLTKPWNAEILKDSLREAFRHHSVAPGARARTTAGA